MGYLYSGEFKIVNFIIKQLGKQFYNKSENE